MTTTLTGEAPPRKRMVGVRDLAEALGVHDNTILAWIKSGKLPPPVRIGRRVIRWKASVIEAFLEGADSR